LFRTRTGIDGSSKRRDGCLLDGDELPRITVVLDIGKGLHQSLVPADPTDPPADHVKAFGQRVDLDPHLAGPGNGQKAERLALECQQDMGRVLDDDNLLGMGEFDDPLVKLASRHAPRRAVGIVQHQQLRSTRDLCRDGIQVRQKIVLGVQWQRYTDPP
jgi:hypothetical protein